MIKKFAFFMFFALFLSGTATALTARSGTVASDYVSANTYNNLYPYMNNTMRTNLNPGTTPSQSNAQINVLTRTKNTPSTTTRNVVARKTTTSNTGTSNTSNTTARAATATTGITARKVSPRTSTTTTPNTARSGTINTATARAASPKTTTTRQVVARAASNNTNNIKTSTYRTSRDNTNVSTARQAATAIYTSTGTAVSSARCMADYTECMNSYCERENTEYNRCYCSSKLAQIDAQYKPEIDRLIKEILTVKNDNYLTNEELNEYWMETIGKYTGDNSWTNLDEALNIDWSSTESRVRGQQAFVMGHEYCVQYLKNCSYMQTNLRDAYRSEIARDCAAYETSLQRLKNAAESIVESYK